MPLIGFDLLGLGHRDFPVAQAIRVCPQGSAIGCFANTFGNAIPHVKKLIQSGKFTAFRIQIWWDNRHRIVPAHTLMAECRHWNDLAIKNPHCTFYLSHSCEHNERSASVVRDRMRIIRQHAPKCIPVNCPWQGALLPEEINEVHDPNKVLPGVYITSTDGENISDIDVTKWHQRHGAALIRFLWQMRFNGRENTGPNQQPPPPKERTAWPSRQYFEGIARLAFPIGEPPLPTFKAEFHPVEKPMIYKPYSEDRQGYDDIRENRPVFLGKEQHDSLEIVTWKNQHIGSLRYGGTFPGGMHRYYSGAPGGVKLYGHEIGEHARKMSQHEFVWLRTARKAWGPINPSFRHGAMR